MASFSVAHQLKQQTRNAFTISSRTSVVHLHTTLLIRSTLLQPKNSMAISNIFFSAHLFIVLLILFTLPLNIYSSLYNYIITQNMFARKYITYYLPLTMLHISYQPVAKKFWTQGKDKFYSLNLPIRLIFSKMSCSSRFQLPSNPDYHEKMFSALGGYWLAAAQRSSEGEGKERIISDARTYSYEY